MVKKSIKVLSLYIRLGYFNDLLFDEGMLLLREWCCSGFACVDVE